MPGIKRISEFSFDKINDVEESFSFIYYKAIFNTDESFKITMNPNIGEKFSKAIAQINGNEEEIQKLLEGSQNRTFNPVFSRNKALKTINDRKKRQIKDLKKKEVQENEDVKELPTDYSEIAETLEKKIDTQEIDQNDPVVIAARLARELSEENKQKS